MNIRSGTWGALALAAALAAAACSDSTAPAGPGTLSLSVSAAPVDSTSSNVNTTPAAGVTQNDGTHTLTLESVQLVVRRIELARADTVCSQGDDDGEHASEWKRVGDCEELALGPILVDVPLDGQVDKVFSVQLPEGTYRGVELQIHRPWHRNQSDLDFLQANPDFDSVSVRAEGTFDGNPFALVEHVEARQRYPIDPPLDVTATSAPTNITLHLDVSTWFLRQDGSLVDPSTANDGGANEYLVRWNIMRSLQAFQDDDHDGHWDGYHSGHGEGG
ncbi:MAG: hypothetical protein LJF04_16625 [Gemmatimonadetes bacterium]|nr:hypothetical protein [Gemmatimonadota bacterium]